MGLVLQETCCSSQVLKPWKSGQETNEEKLFIKSRQQSRQKYLYWDLKLKLDKNSTETISVETYEIRTSRSDFWPMLKYFYRVSFLTTLNIYKAYFKGCRACRKWPSSLFSLKEATKSLHQGFCDQGASWSSLLMKWRTLQPTTSSSCWS